MLFITNNLRVNERAEVTLDLSLVHEFDPELPQRLCLTFERGHEVLVSGIAELWLQDALAALVHAGIEQERHPLRFSESMQIKFKFQRVISMIIPYSFRRIRRIAYQHLHSV